MRRCFVVILLIPILISYCGLPGMRHDVPQQKNERNKVHVDKILREAEYKNKSLSAKNLLSYIRMYIGTPYKKGGDSFKGMDCSGFVMTVFNKAFDTELPHNAAMIYQQTTPVATGEIQTGDLVFFENIAGKGISHVGIYLIKGNFVHSSSYFGVTISNLKKAYYRQRFKGVRRVDALKSN